MIISTKYLITGDGTTVLTDKAVYVGEDGKIGKIAPKEELLKEFPCAAKSVQFRALHAVFCRRGEKSSSGGARAASAAAAWAKARTGNAAPPTLSTVLLYNGKKAHACCCAFFSIYHSIQAFPGGEGVAERRRMRDCIQLA